MTLIIKLLWHHSWVSIISPGPYNGLAELENGDKVWFCREKETNNFVSAISDYSNISVDMPLEIDEKLLKEFFKIPFDPTKPIDDNGIEDLLKQAEENWSRKIKDERKATEIQYTSYYNIYGLTPHQLKCAQDYYSEYIEKIGYNKDHVNYAPIDMDKGEFIQFSSSFNPDYMCCNESLLGKVHYNDVKGLRQQCII